MITVIDLEANPDTCGNGLGIAPREKREQLEVGMFARVHARENGGRRVERLWFKIMSVDKLETYPLQIRYRGELVSDTHFDLDYGFELLFGPKHVCEWTTVKPHDA